jgi:hypothetical protein
MAKMSNWVLHSRKYKYMLAVSEHDVPMHRCRTSKISTDWKTSYGRPEAGIIAGMALPKA